jgi:hypothetical protein
MSTWRIIHDCPGYMVGYRAIVDEEGYTIVAPSPMGADNARLIAAVPDMLAALSLLIDGDGKPDECPRAMDAARIAYRKAMGWA